jgi:hypothetical protein
MSDINVSWEESRYIPLNTRRLLVSICPAYSTVQREKAPLRLFCKNLSGFQLGQLVGEGGGGVSNKS